MIKEKDRVALDPGVVCSKMQMKTPKPIDICKFLVPEQYYVDWVKNSNTVRIFNNFAKLENLTPTVEQVFECMRMGQGNFYKNVEDSKYNEGHDYLNQLPGQAAVTFDFPKERVSAVLAFHTTWQSQESCFKTARYTNLALD